MRSIKFDTKKLLADSMLFTISELGCYIRLATHYWVTGTLPGDHLTLARIAGCSLGDFKAAWAKVSTQFEKNDKGGLTCPELDAERKAIRKKSKQARASANARWRKAVE